MKFGKACRCEVTVSKSCSVQYRVAILVCLPMAPPHLCLFVIVHDVGPHSLLYQFFNVYFIPMTWLNIKSLTVHNANIATVTKGRIQQHVLLFLLEWRLQLSFTTFSCSSKKAPHPTATELRWFYLRHCVPRPAAVHTLIPVDLHTYECMCTHVGTARAYAKVQCSMMALQQRGWSSGHTHCPVNSDRMSY